MLFLFWGVGLLNLMLLLLAGHPLFKGLDVKRFEHYPIMGVESPSTLLLAGEAWYVGADLQGMRPGVYRLGWKGDVLHAGLLKILPQLEVESLSVKGHMLQIQAAYRFTTDPKDWTGQQVALDLETLVETASRAIPPNAMCGNGRFECGLVAAFPLENGKLLTVSESRSVLSIYGGPPGHMKLESMASLMIENRAASVSEVRLIGDDLIFLVRNYRLLASLPLKEAIAAGWGSIRLEPVFDFSSMAKTLYVKDVSMNYAGLAEGFAFDDQGSLLLLLNNRREPFDKLGPKGLEREPRLVMFPKVMETAASEK